MSESTFPDEVKALHTALAKAQGAFPTIARDKTVSIRTKDGGSFSYTYADLGSILTAVRPALEANELAIVQRLEAPNGTPSLRTELLHSGGAAIASSFPLGEWGGDPKQLGSLITYLRRYALTALLGIAADEDTDAPPPAAARPAARAAAPAKTESTPAPETPAATGDTTAGAGADLLTSNQRRMIFAVKGKLTAAGAFTDDEFQAQLYADFGVDSVSGLTNEEASTLIERLLAAEDRLPQELDT